MGAHVRAESLRTSVSALSHGGHWQGAALPHPDARTRSDTHMCRCRGIHVSGTQAVSQRPARVQVLAWATCSAAVPEEGLGQAGKNCQLY